MNDFSNNGFLKRNILIYLGIAICIYYILLKIGICTFLGVNSFLTIVLMAGDLVGLLLSVFICLGSFYYYSHKAKDMTILILAIILMIMVIFGLFGLQFVSSVFGNFNFNNILSAVPDIEGMISSTKIFNCVFYFAYLTGFYSLVLCLDMHRIVIVPAINNYCSKVYSLQASPVNEHVIKNIDSSQFPTKSKKSRKKILIIFGFVISLFFVCGGSYYIYTTFFNKTKTIINLVETVKLTCTGRDGSGYAIISASDDYVGESSNIIKFLAGVDYEINETSAVENGELSNGQKVTVVAEYSRSDADKYNIEVISDTFETEVSGLINTYTKGSEIPRDILEKMKADVDKKAQNSLMSSTIVKRSVELESMYLAKTKIGKIKVIVVYKHTTQSLLDENESPDIKYISYYLDNPQSNYSQKNSWFTGSLFSSDSKMITKKEDVKSAMISNYNLDASSLEELKVSTNTTTSSDEYI